MPAGRPRKFETPEEIEAMAEKYFAKCDKEETPYTVTGLALSLGTYRDVLIDYESGTYDTEEHKFSNAIKAVKARVEEYAEQRVYAHTAGAAFMLTNLSRTHKNPWKNAQHQEVTGANGGPVNITVTPTQASIL